MSETIRQQQRKMLSLKRKVLREENRKWPATLRPVARDRWPEDLLDAATRIAVWRSRHFLVQAFEEAGLIRLSISRTELNAVGDWKDGISWDELQDLKRQAGYGEMDAVEIYPAEKDVVNVANIRHLWVWPGELSYKWRDGK